MSAEQVLKSSSAIVSVIPGMHLVGLIAYPLGLAQQQLFKALGISQKRAASMSYSQPIGQVTVALLCALARNGYPIERVVQAEDGCFIEAALPSNWQSWKGAIACTVTTRPSGREIHISTTTPGIWSWSVDLRFKKVISIILDEVSRDSASF